MMFLRNLYDKAVFKYLENIFTDSERLEETQYYPVESLKAMQYEKVGRFIHALVHGNPNWKKHLQKAGLSECKEWNEENFPRIPILTKTTYKQQAYADYAVRKPFQKIYRVTTSGTCGIPWAFFIDNYAHFWRYKAILRGNQWAGFQKGDAFFHTLMSPYPGSIPVGHFFSFRNAASLIEAKAILEKIFEQRTVLMYGFIEFFRAFSKLILAEEFSMPRIRSVISTGELLDSEERCVLENIFSAPVFDGYSTRECGRMAQECRMKNGQHYHAERFLFEIVDEDGNRLPDGIPGSIIVTDFYNFATPFLRFATEDRGYMTREPCRCGMTLPRLFLEGRDIDVLFLENEQSIRISGLTGAFNAKAQYVERYQVVQHGINDFEIRIVPTKLFHANIWEAIQSNLQARLGSHAKISYSIVGLDALLHNGKFIPVVNELSRGENQ